MIDTEIIFLNGSNTFNGKKTFGKNTVVPLKKLDKTNKKQNTFFQEKKDKISIKKLEENITNIFIFHQEHNNFPTLFPQKIYFNFLRDTYYEQYQHYKNQDKEIKLETENQLRIKENLKPEEKVDNPYEKYAEIKPNDKKHSIITELVILHEVAHWISAQKLSGTLLSRSFRDVEKEKNKPNFKINYLKNISKNILEGFSDCFAIYLTQQHYKQYNIIDTYKKCRDETSKISKKSVGVYDLSDVFNEIKALSSSNNNMDSVLDNIL